MTTLRQGTRKFRRVGESFSVRGLANFLGVEPPISARDLIRRLAPETVVRQSGQLGPSTVTGSASLGFTSEGFWTFQGHVHESGAVGHDYGFGAMLKFVDPEGKAFAYGNSGTVHGTFAPGSRDSDWMQSGYDRRIGTHWDEIKNSAVQFKLEVDTDVGDVVFAIAVALFAAPALVVFELAEGDPRVVCELSNPPPGTEHEPGPEAKCLPATGAEGPWSGF